MTIKIESVAQPIKRRRYPFHLLTPGTPDSFFIAAPTIKDRLRLDNTIRACASRRHFKVRIRMEEGGLRVWRTA